MIFAYDVMLMDRVEQGLNRVRIMEVDFRVKSM
jgi:hypothetical protein